MNNPEFTRMLEMALSRFADLNNPECGHNERVERRQHALECLENLCVKLRVDTYSDLDVSFDGNESGRATFSVGVKR